MQPSTLSSTISIVVIIVAAGFWGGLTNFLLTKTSQDGWLHFWRCVVAGICAAFAVPLFLQVIQSNLLDNDPPTTLSYLKFAGFCLLAAVGSRAFLDSLAKKALRLSEEAKDTAEKAHKDADAVIDATSEADTPQLDADTVPAKGSDADLPQESRASNAAKGFASPLTPSNAAREVPEDFSKDLRKPSATGITGLPIEQFRVLKALASPEYAFRTIRGIQGDAQIPRENVQTCLDQLKEQGLANMLHRKDQLLWYATAGGRAILNRRPPSNLKTESS